MTRTGTGDICSVTRVGHIFEEHKKGSIEPGKLADLVVLSADPTQVDPMTIKDIPVDMTIVGGEVVNEGQR